MRASGFTMPSAIFFMATKRFCFLVGLKPSSLPPLLEMIWALRDGGHEVILYYASDVIDEVSTFVHPSHTFFQKVKLQSPWDRFLVPWRIRREFRKFLQRQSFSAVVACDALALQVLSHAKTPAKKVYWGFELTGFSGRFNFSGDGIRYLLFPQFVKKMDFVLCSSIERKSLWCSRFPQFCDRVYVVRNLRAKRFTYRRNETTRGKKSLVFAGRISFTSGIQHIIAGLQDCPNLELTLLGHMDQSFHTWWSSGDFRNVSYGGAVENSKLIDALSLYDCSVCCYVKNDNAGIEARYPAPTKLGDAYAAGCIPFCSDQPYMVDMISTHQSGIAFSFDKVQQALRNLNAMAHQEINEMRQRVTFAFQSEYSMHHERDIFLSLFHD